MTRDEYLRKIKDNLQSLTIDEQNEAMQFYYDYFEDAGFDEEKIFKDLGTPEEVAEKIKLDLSNALVKSSEEKKDEDTEDKKSAAYNGGEENASLYYEFDKDCVKNISFSFAAVEVVCISGSKFAVESRGIMRENLYCRLEGDTLVCKNINQLQNFRFFSHVRKSGFVPRILITVPEKTEINDLNVKIGAGKFETRKVNINCNKCSVDVGAGNCILEDVYGKNLVIHCGMGNLNISGGAKGYSKIDCGMGSIKMNIKGDPASYSFDSKVGLGSVEINNEKREGFGQDYSQPKKENHFSVNCGMGSVKILINK